jgi:hypothetical protein
MKRPRCGAMTRKGVSCIAIRDLEYSIRPIHAMPEPWRTLYGAENRQRNRTHTRGCQSAAEIFAGPGERVAGLKQGKA